MLPDKDFEAMIILRASPREKKTVSTVHLWIIWPDISLLSSLSVFPQLTRYLNNHADGNVPEHCLCHNMCLIGSNFCGINQFILELKESMYHGCHTKTIVSYLSYSVNTWVWFPQIYPFSRKFRISCTANRFLTVNMPFCYSVVLPSQNGSLH